MFDVSIFDLTIDISYADMEEREKKERYGHILGDAYFAGMWEFVCVCVYRLA